MQDIRFADPHRPFVETGKAVGDTNAETLFIAEAVLDPVGIDTGTNMLRVLEAVTEPLLGLPTDSWDNVEVDEYVVSHAPNVALQSPTAQYSGVVPHLRDDCGADLVTIHLKLG